MHNSSISYAEWHKVQMAENRLFENEIDSYRFNQSRSGYNQPLKKIETKIKDHLELLENDLSQEIDAIKPSLFYFDNPCIGCNQRLEIFTGQLTITCPHCKAAYVKIQ